MKIYTPIILSVLIDNKETESKYEYNRFLTKEGIFRIKNNDFYKYDIDDDTSIYSDYCIIDNSIRNLKKVNNLPYPHIKENVQELHYKINEYTLVVEYVNEYFSDYYFINIKNIDKFNEFLRTYS